MKVVSPIAGTVAVHTSIDDVVPPIGLLQADLVATANALYHFNNTPVIRPNTPPIPILVFQTGVFVSEQARIPIIQLNIAPDGDSVTAQDTDLAETVINDYVAHMNNDLGYRYTGNEPRLYHSVLVADFDPEFTKKIAVFGTIEDVLAGAMPQAAKRYRFKTLTFGMDASEAGGQASILQAIPTDFSIDRRASASFEQNRFYCIAPLQTADHVQVLESIERAALESN